jgi:hypothetical protein
MPHKKSHQPEGMHMDMQAMGKKEAAHHAKTKLGAKHTVRHHSASAPMTGMHNAPHPKSGGGGMIPGGGAKSAVHGQAPPATSIQGSLGIIENVRKGKDHNMGIPGIISSTSLGPEQRQRLVAGIIESPMADGAPKEGPVSKVEGHDSTAYNAGMIHIRGSHFK